jgi:hypothetical protein
MGCVRHSYTFLFVEKTKDEEHLFHPPPSNQTDAPY